MYEFNLKLNDADLYLRTDINVNAFKHGWNSPGHNHALYEGHILLSGKARVDVEGDSRMLSKGQIMLIAPGQYHWAIGGEGEMERLSFQFAVSGGPVQEALQANVSGYCIEEASPAILAACRDIFDEAAERTGLTRLMIQSHLIRLLGGTLRLLGIDLRTEGVQHEPGEEANMTKIDKFFRNCRGEKVKLEDLATILYLSKGQTNRLLLEQYGMTFREKLLQSRMEQAVRLLRYTDMAVYQIAEKVGYSASSSFYHVFRDRFGVTPEEYRAARQDQDDMI